MINLVNLGVITSNLGVFLQNRCDHPFRCEGPDCAVNSRCREQLTRRRCGTRHDLLAHLPSGLDQFMVTFYYINFRHAQHSRMHACPKSCGRYYYTQTKRALCNITPHGNGRFVSWELPTQKASIKHPQNLPDPPTSTN